MTTLSAITLKELENTINQIAISGKGILAADESTGTIIKRFTAVGISCTEETRRCYRELLFTTPELSHYIAGIILYEETLNQISSKGIALPELISNQEIVPGIKVDKGLALLPGTADEKVTQGLDGLMDRLQEYKKKGVRFAKWRAVFTISQTTPSSLAIKANAYNLGYYAALCQKMGIVPIVEPEVLIDGDHTIDTSASVTENVLHHVFHALNKFHVILEYAILKPSMVIAGNKSLIKNTPQEVAKSTLDVLQRSVPVALPTINFLSGGQTPEQATANLNAMYHIETKRPWNLSFSYARALQEPCMIGWAGKAENKEYAQQLLLIRAKLNSLASKGEYNPALENEVTH